MNWTSACRPLTSNISDAGVELPLLFRDRGRLSGSYIGSEMLNARVGSDQRHPQRLNQVKSLSPHHRFVIALHSPAKVTETGLRICRPEKGRQINAFRSRAVRSLQFTLLTKYCGIRACFAYFAAKAELFLCSLDLLAERAVSR